MSRTNIPHRFRKMSLAERWQVLSDHLQLTPEEMDLLKGRTDLSDLSDVLIETSIGNYPVPLGLASGFIIDGEEFIIPMATEEPSVIAAASYGACLVSSGGGFTTSAEESIISGQIFLLNPRSDAEEKVRCSEEEIAQFVNQRMPKMVQRGGGFCGISLESIENPHALCVTLHLNVCEAMGANVINSIAENLKDKLATLTGGQPLMSIVTNSASMSKGEASFSVPCRLFRKGNRSGEEVCERIVMAMKIANVNPERAVTHNKGIMNGISALALATGNDTRAIEAGAYLFAVQKGQMRSLTSYSCENGTFRGSITIPVAIGTVGGSVSSWPMSQLCLKLLGNPKSKRLRGIAAALGLAQNLAALFALVTDGIQLGHMQQHAARIAYAAGARGKELRPIAARLSKEGALDLENAYRIVQEMRRSHD